MGCSNQFQFKSITFGNATQGTYHALILRIYFWQSAQTNVFILLAAQIQHQVTW